MTVISKNQFSIALTLLLPNGPYRVQGAWETKSGGLADSNAYTHMPGNMGPQTAVAGTQTVSELVIGRSYDLERDEGLGVIDTLLYWRGKARCRAQQISLDANEAVFQTGWVMTGILKSVQLPDYDAAAVSENAVMTVTIMLDGTIARSA